MKRPEVIYIVDTLGIHSGMHYYSEALVDTLGRELPIKVLSNYSTDLSRPFFSNFYGRNKLSGALLMLLGWMKLLLKVLGNRNEIFIVMSYGEWVNLPFLRVVSFSRRCVVDIHEVVAQASENNKRLRKAYGRLYSRKIKNVIIHSSRSSSMLDELGYAGNRLFVPHFRYCFGKTYDDARLGEDVRNAFVPSLTNILFFGNMTVNKGVDILIEAADSLPGPVREKVHFVISGKPNDYDPRQNDIRHPELFSIVARHINDDELVFLYSGADYVVLPYRKTSQSGILEMAVYFRKPVIASRIDYFRHVLTDFPSFGRLTGLSAQELGATLAEAPGWDRTVFFTQPDMDRYIHKEEMTAFREAFLSCVEWDTETFRRP